MKKILIVSHAMELGGAERSLLGLLSSIDPKRYKVDLFLLRHAGELLSYIPAYIHLLPEIPEYTVLARPMADTLKEGHFLLTCARLRGKIAAALFDRKHSYTESGVALEYSHKYTCHLMPDIQPDIEYDAAISFLTPHYFAAEKVRAKKKIAWIHTDYSRVSVDIASEVQMWSRYDSIVSISDAVTAGFIKTFPSLAQKIVKIENILPADMIQKQADAFSADVEMPRNNNICLLSIGRYCFAKNFDNVPDITRRLLNMGLNVKWYLIGFGGDENLIKKKIDEAGMQRNVIMLGKKDNPYPYVKACDLYVQPSRYEGKSVTVREAQMLGKPVVITKYPTSSSQLEDGIDGVIVPMDNQHCAEGIADLLNDPEKMEKIQKNCASRDYSNSEEIEKLYQLFEGISDAAC